jgi:hypothetical protein
MFMQGYNPIQYYDVRQRELLAEAERYRLLRQVSGSAAHELPLLTKSLARLGRYLADLGASLEKRYGTYSGDTSPETVRVS